MDLEILLKRIEDLEQEIFKLKEKLANKNKSKHSIIKTTKKEIIDYWERIQDECGLSVDWAEARERCWRCGYKANLQICHIIPDSLGGKDEPSNLVLLCARCHIDAPNVESKTFMWDWIRANGTPLYDTFWDIRAQKEYEFIYGKSFRQELIDRDILSYYDLSLFHQLKIGRSIHHFAHPWNNESTDAGLLRMRLEEFDKKHPVIKKKSASFRAKENAFDSFIYDICDIAKKFNFNVWEGRSKNRFSVTLSSFIDREKNINLSIKLCKDNIYKACFTDEWNPNNNTNSEYKIVLGYKDDALLFIIKEIEKFVLENGMMKSQNHVFTINPFLRLKDNYEM